MSVTAARGFTAAGVRAGIKASGRHDLAVVRNEGPSRAAAGVVMTRAAWDAALDAYYDEHDDVGTGPDARGPGLFVVTDRGRTWEVRQILDDPAGNRDWALVAEVDLDASDAAGELVLRTIDLSRLD